MEKKQILIVEDQRITAEDIKETLEGLGYAIAGIIDSGEAAIQITEKVQPDLVLMDIVLKGKLDGITTAQHFNTKGIPVIYLTSYANKAIVERAKLTEPLGYLVKPFKEQDLYSTIEIALHNRKKTLQEQKTETLSQATPLLKTIQSNFSSEIQQISLLPPSRQKNSLLIAMNEIEARLGKLLYIQALGQTCQMILDSPRERLFDLKIPFQQVETYCNNGVLLKTHRSYLVMLERVLYIKKKNIRDYELWLKNFSKEPTSIPVGRSNILQLRESHPKWFIH